MSTPPLDTTLQSLLAMVGPPVLQALCMPHGPDAAAGEPRLLDLAEGVVAPPGAVLEAVGCRPSSSHSPEVIKAAGAAGLAAVAMKAYGEPIDHLVDCALEAGVALLLVDDGVLWHHLHVLLSSALRRSGRPADESLSTLAAGDLFALANAVAAMVGGAVAIEDPQQRVLAYSTVAGQPIDGPREAGILGRRVPAEYRLAELYEDVRRFQGVRRVALEGVRPRLAVAVRAGDEPLGSIWAIEGDSGFPPEATKALADAADIAALHMLRLRITADVERTARSEALRALLLGRTNASGDLLPTVDAHDLTVVGFQIIGQTAGSDSTLTARTADLITVHGESLDRRSACLAIGDTLYALLPTAVAGERQRIIALVASIRARAAESLHVRLRAGIGGTVRDLAGVRGSRREADRVLQVLADRGDTPSMATIEDVRSSAILLQLHEIMAADAGLNLDVVATMADHDRDKHTQYVATLRAYLDAFGDVPTAAGRLVLHQNTFRHRMRRITEIFGVDIDDPDERLVLWLQLRAAR